MNTKKSLLYAFLPWIAFTTKPGVTIPDHGRFRFAIVENCAAVSPTEKNIFNVEIVNSRESREKGLGGRKKKLSANEGMLFQFDPPMPVSFWMKDTWIPLQIVYFDIEGKLTKTYEMPVEKNPDKPLGTYPSLKPAIAALEIAPHRLTGKISKLMLCIEAK